MAHYDISIPEDGDPESQNVHERDTIRWTNDSGKVITGFTLPACVGAQASVGPIQPGDATQTYPIQDKTKVHSYPYSVVVANAAITAELHIFMPRNGTIDVS